MKIHILVLLIFIPFFKQMPVANQTLDKVFSKGIEQQMFEIVTVCGAKKAKKTIGVKDKKMIIKIRSNNDMGNSTLLVVLNGQKVKHDFKETGTESIGVKIKVVTSVNYDLVVECQGKLKPGENELKINGYGDQQVKIFKVGKD
jgi:hypothetical protein